MPLTGQIREAVSSAWGLDVGDAGERLLGGEESAVFHLGAEVVRIGPAWRTTSELEDITCRLERIERYHNLISARER